jgi:hypothetical protein
MANRILFHKRTSGPFGRGYDCWYLLAMDDGTYGIEHAWSHPAALADGDDDVGTATVSAGQFFAKLEDRELLGKLRAAITRAIVDDSGLAFAALEFGAERPFRFDPFATAIDWLSACRARDLDRLMTFYAANATLDCACTGENICNGASDLRTYWRKRLADPSPATFTLQDIWPSGDATVLDYVSHNGQLVRSFFHFGDDGLVIHTRCGPVELAKAG